MLKPRQSTTKGSREIPRSSAKGSEGCAGAKARPCSALFCCFVMGVSENGVCPQMAIFCNFDTEY